MNTRSLIKMRYAVQQADGWYVMFRLSRCGSDIHRVRCATQDSQYAHDFKTEEKVRKWIGYCGLEGDRFVRLTPEGYEPPYA